MAKFPEPPTPAVLAALGAATHTLPVGTRVWRIFFMGGGHPTAWSQFRAWGPTDARFDHHLPPPSLQSREILYGAIEPQAGQTVIAEVFQSTRVVERAWRAPCLVAFDTTEPLHLLDLRGAWPTKAGASTAITSGVRSRARRWSQTIYAAFPDVDGLIYGSSMNGNQPCVALYERANRAMPAHPMFIRMLSDPAMLTILKNACVSLNYVLA